MKPDDFAGYRPHQIRRLLRRGRRPVALRARQKEVPGQGPKKEQNSSLFPGGDVRLLTSAPDWAFTGPNKLPTFPGPAPPGILATERSEPIIKDPLLPLPLPAPDQAGLPGTPENQREDIALQAPEVSAPQAHEEKDDMNDNSSFTEPEIPEPAETEQDFQKPEIELPLPVIVALQEREARKESSAGCAEGGSSGRSKPQKVALRARQEDDEQDISLSHHAARCSICQHPDRDAIEQGYLHWENPTLLAYEYGLGQRRAVYRHARAFGLREKRAARTRRSLEFVIEQGETLTATADSLIRAVRAYSCLSEDGRWTEPVKRVIITHEHRDGSTAPDFEEPQVANHGLRRVQTATLGDGHAVPSKNAVTPAPPTKVEKLMDTLFNRFAR